MIHHLSRPGFEHYNLIFVNQGRFYNPWRYDMLRRDFSTVNFSWFWSSGFGRRLAADGYRVIGSLDASINYMPLQEELSRAFTSRATMTDLLRQTAYQASSGRKLGREWMLVNNG